MRGFPYKIELPSGIKGFKPISLLFRPYEKKDMPKLTKLMGDPVVCRYLNTSSPPTLEAEMEWLKKQTESKDEVVWGICPIVSGDALDPIGTTSFNKWGAHGETGFVLYNREWWGKGVASAAHIFRTGEMFLNQKIEVVSSHVYEGNPGSSKALEKMGYQELCLRMVDWIEFDGETRYMRYFEVVNPLEKQWNQRWFGRKVPKSYHDARKKTQRVLDLYRKYVTPA